MTRYPNLLRLFAYAGGLAIAAVLAFIVGFVATKLGAREGGAAFLAGCACMFGLTVLDEVMEREAA